MQHGKHYSRADPYVGDDQMLVDAVMLKCRGYFGKRLQETSITGNSRQRCLQFVEVFCRHAFSPATRRVGADLPDVRDRMLGEPNLYASIFIHRWVDRE